MNDGYWQRLKERQVSRRAFTGSAGIALAGSAALLAGCGGGNDAKPTTTDGREPGNGATPAAGSATAAAGTPGKRGGTLLLSGPSPHPTFDPADRVTHWPHLAKVYSHLVQFQFSTGQALFDAAAKLEQPDAFTLRFTIRDGMTFHDGVAGGRPVTAEDVAYSLNRVRQQAGRAGGPLAGSQVTPMYWGWIDRVDATDTKTVVIKQVAPYASALATLGTLAFAIVAKEAVDAAGGLLKTDQVGKDAGSGPYTLTRLDDRGYTWERWARYWKHASPTGTFVEDGPYIDKIQWKQLDTAAAAEAALRSGEIDILGYVSGSSSQIAWDKLKPDELSKVAGVKVASAPNPRALIGAFDNARWTDARLREALSLAIDREALIKTLYGGEGVLGGLLPSVFKESALSEAQLRAAQVFDAKKAKQLWESGGGPAAFPQVVMLTQANTPLLVSLTNFIADEWRRNLGLAVNIEAVDASTFVRRANDTAQATKDWDFCITSESFLLTVPEANGLALYAPASFGGTFGNLRLDGERTRDLARRLQDLHDAQVKEANAAERKKKLETLQLEHLKSFAPGLPIPMAKLDYAAYRETVKNFPANDFQMGSSSTNAIRAHNLWLDRA